MNLRDRLQLVLTEWHSADEFSPADLEGYLDSLEESVKDWLFEGAQHLRTRS